MAEVLHTILTGAWSRKRRLLATAISVILGVAFLMGTLVIGTSARAGFETAFGDANAGTDALVRSADQLDAGEQPLSRPFDEAVAQTILSVEGVTKVEPVVEGVAQIMTADGELLGGNGPPTLGAAWIEDPALTGYELAEGRAPAAPGEVVVDKKSATDGDLAVGDVVTILTPDRVEATVVGIATFGDEDSLGGTTLAAFALPEAQRVLLGGPGQVTGVVVGAAEGIDQAQLIQRLEPALPADLEAITGDDLTEEQQEAIESDFLGVFVTGLLAFAGIALLVAAFSIFNTFTILAAQRTRESALLRTLGASRAQVLIAGVAEAAVVGVLGAALGVAGGIGLAQALLALRGSAGMGLPVDGITVNGSHLAVAAGVGVVVTIAGGLAPAWRAA
ncbi:MAG TPA: FtsX-like permease family protein, partial [Acidimicrobiales bacterium]